jgi:8-oxo-dGTP pyrophosphatase MutT (NUDIX family)
MKSRRSFWSKPRRALGLLGPRKDSAGRRIQVGALPWRTTEGALELLLVTSRNSNRWILPKGWPMRGKTMAGAAAQEALEEAGVEGEIEAQHVGAFEHFRRDARADRPGVSILVFPMKVRRVLQDWPEKGQRLRQWFPAEDAARQVDSDQLAQIIRDFAGAPRET